MGLASFKAAALLQVSDVIPTRKSLFCGRTDEEMAERQRIKAEVVPRILLDTLAAAG